ncbi:HIT family protein [Deltaproteobacteria bacterium TL4]
MPSIFSKIIAGEIPCEKIYETEKEMAFLDILPVATGHTLVVPKREVLRLEDLTVAEASSLMTAMKIIAKAVSQAYGGVDYNLILNNGPGAGQEVPHVHFHIIPRPEGSFLGFKNRHKYQDGEMRKVGNQIRACIEA